MTDPPADGALLFARYAFAPNALGLCGPDDHQALLDYADASVVDDGLRELAMGFAGAWPYLELLAGCSGIVDPLDRRVVEAYWLGNELAFGVRPRDLAGHAYGRFRAAAGADTEAIAVAAMGGLPPTHGFHVFTVYPWVGLLRQGRDEPALRVLDQCRISWGQVVEVRGDHAVVLSPRLERQPARLGSGGLGSGGLGSGLGLGAPVAGTYALARGGASLVHGVQAGDHVSLHWDWVCDRLTPRQLQALRSTTLADLRTANRALSPRMMERLS